MKLINPETIQESEQEFIDTINAELDWDAIEKMLLEKHNFTRGSCNECFVVEKIHLTEVHVSHLLELDGLSIISINGESLALSVERVDNVLIRVVETLVREIL